MLKKLFPILLVIAAGILLSVSVFKHATTQTNRATGPVAVTVPTNATVVVPPPHGMYLAANPDFGTEEDAVTEAVIQDYIALVGRGMAWAYFSNNWYKGLLFPTEAVRIIHSNGSIPFIRMMPRSNAEENIAEPTFTLQRIIAGDFDTALTQWADDARSVGYPLLVEFGTEVNGEWFSWNGKFNGGETEGPQRFVHAYRHVIDLFRRRGVTTITWFYHVAVPSNPDTAWNSYQAYYPGDDYIDWIGLSVYGAQRYEDDWLSFTDILDQEYQKLVLLFPNKPLAVVEWGVYENPEAGDKATWIRDALAAMRQGRYPRIKALSYWNDKFENDDGSVTNLRVDSDPLALQAYRDGVASPYFVTDPYYGDAGTGRIAAREWSWGTGKSLSR